MSPSAFAALFIVAAPAYCTEAPVAKPRSEMSSLAAFNAPSGWDERKRWVLEDPLVEFSSGPFQIQVALLGGKDSRHGTPSAFLSSQEARSDGKPADRAGFVRIDGRRLPVYKRRYTFTQGDPQVPEPPSFQQTNHEDFVAVPLPGKERFFVLTFHIEGEPVYEPKEHPAELKAAQAEWKKFLAGFKLKK